MGTEIGNSAWPSMAPWALVFCFRNKQMRVRVRDGFVAAETPRESLAAGHAWRHTGLVLGRYIFQGGEDESVTETRSVVTGVPFPAVVQCQRQVRVRRRRRSPQTQRHRRPGRYGAGRARACVLLVEQ